MSASLLRERYLERVGQDALALERRRTDEPPVLLELIGGAGSGKSTILDDARAALRQSGIATPLLVDVEPPERHSRLAVLEAIAREAATSGEPLVEFEAALKRHAVSEDETRAQAHAEAIAAFREDWGAASVRTPRVLLLDSCEKAPAGTSSDSPLNACFDCDGRTLLVLATQRALALTGEAVVEQMLVQGLSDEEVAHVAKLLAAESPIGVRMPAAETLATLRRRTAGRPLLIRVALSVHLLGWLDLDDLMAGFTPDVGRGALMAIESHDGRLARLIRLLSVIVHRVDADLLAEVAQLSPSEIATTVALGIRIGAIRELDTGSIRLHEEVRDLVARVTTGGASETEAAVRRAASAHQARAALLLAGGADAIEQLSAALYYRSHFEPAEAGSELSSLVAGALEANNLESARRAVSIAISEDLREDLGARVATAMVANRAFEPSAAITALGNLGAAAETSRAGLVALSHIAKAEAITNPCTMIGADPGDAVSAFSVAAELYRRTTDRRGLVRTLAGRGWVEMQLGRHDAAESTLHDAIALARDLGDAQLLPLSLEYLGELYRLIQSLDEAEPVLREAADLRSASDKPLAGGFGVFTLANLARDRWDFEEAERLYLLADSIFRRTNNPFGLQECLNDRSWLRFLDGDSLSATSLLDEQLTLVSRYSFGAGRATYFHGVYELAADVKDYEKADAALDEGLAAARLFSHTYMLVDLLHHDAQRAYRQGRPARVFGCLEELQSIERRGCRVQVFRGRTMLICGDIAADNGNWGEAVGCWMSGLLIVALHGDSRTNVELFEDIVAARVDRVRQALQATGEVARWNHEWKRQASATRGYPVMKEAGLLG